jgi:hypothetical protein
VASPPTLSDEQWRKLTKTPAGHRVELRLAGRPGKLKGKLAYADERRVAVVPNDQGGVPKSVKKTAETLETLTDRAE